MDRYEGRLDDDWDAYRERVFKNAKVKGWIPADAELTPRPEGIRAWGSTPESERPFQCRWMEVCAGFAGRGDAEVDRFVDEVDRLGCGDNTLILGSGKTDEMHRAGRAGIEVVTRCAEKKAAARST